VCCNQFVGYQGTANGSCICEVSGGLAIDVDSDFECLKWPSVRYGASGAPKNAGPWPNSPPGPAERPGAGRVILRLPAPAAGPDRSPDGSPLKQMG